MTLATDIQKLVETEQIKGQLNPAVLQMVLDLQKNATALEADLAQHKKLYELERVTVQRQRSEIDAAGKKLEAIAAREAACAEREKAMTKLELDAAHHATRVEDHKEMFRLVFRNIETRRDVFTAVPGQRGSDGSYTMAATPHVAQNEQRTSAE